MKKIMVVTIILAIGFFSGCTSKPKVKKIFVQSAYPTLKMLKPLPSSPPIVELQDYYLVDEKYIAINMNNLGQVKSVSYDIRKLNRTQRKYIKFYEFQNKEFNKKYGESK